MTHYKRFIPATSPNGNAAAASLFTGLGLARLRARELKRHNAELDNWESEGGSVAARLAVAREPTALARGVRRGSIDAATR